MDFIRPVYENVSANGRERRVCYQLLSFVHVWLNRHSGGTYVTFGYKCDATENSYARASEIGILLSGSEVDALWRLNDLALRRKTDTISIPFCCICHEGINIEFRITNIPTGGRKFEIREEGEGGHFIRIPYNSLRLFLIAVKPIIVMKLVPNLISHV